MLLSLIVIFQGVPFIANYAATKSWDLVLAEGLAAELEPRGVAVLAVAPGFTQSELSPTFDFKGPPIRPLSPEESLDNLLGPNHSSG